jgi:hypothetical protein
MRPAWARWVVAIACFAALALTVAAPAFGDADPASDELIGFDSYYPYSPQVSKSLQNQLDGALRATRKNGHVYKVVLIEAPPDLGAATALYGKPKTYAKFLYNEIHSFLAAQHPTYLVLTKQGAELLGKDATAAGKQALAKIKIPSNASSDQLAQTAITAVRSIAAANGHPISDAQIAAASQSHVGSPSSKSSHAWLWIVVAAMIVIAGACGAWLLRERRRDQSPLTD